MEVCVVRESSKSTVGALFAILNTKNVKIKASDAVDSSLRFIYNALWYAIQKSSYRGPL
jgi:hypothetical protein